MSYCFQCYAEDYELSQNITHSTVSGIAAYRSALTLDWLAEEDSRQRVLAHVFETEQEQPTLDKDLEQCMLRYRPTPGKVARLMLELLKHIEGQDNGVIQELTKTLIRTKLLIQTSMLDAEPDLESLVKTPTLLQGEPHATLPRVLAVVWVLATDPVATENSGWCTINKFSHYLMVSSPTEIAARMRAIDPIIARARFIIEEFVQTLSPLYLRRGSPAIDLRPKLRRYRNRPLYPLSPTRSTLRADVIYSSYSSLTRTIIRNNVEESVNTDNITMPGAPPIPEAIVMEPNIRSVDVKLSNAARILPHSYVCVCVCLVICVVMI